jgi:hypothetical protein
VAAHPRFCGVRLCQQQPDGPPVTLTGVVDGHGIW